MKDLVTRVPCVLFTLTAFGCSSGSDSGSSSTGDETNLAQQAEFSAADVDHLLRRTQFGVSVEGRAAVASGGVPAFVDAMLTFPAEETAVEREAAQLLANDDDPAGLEGRFPSANDVTEWWLHLMMHSDAPFQERLAMFWHDHFAVSSDGLNGQERHWMVDLVQLLRRQGVGNFRTLVVEVSRSSAMLEWLDSTSNVRGEPNENFAREFFELFTAGADNGYTEADIQEASRAFTGYRNRLDADTNLRYTEFDSERKDIFAKVLFDDVVVRGNGEDGDDFQDVVDVTFANLPVAEWLAEKLLLEFVNDAPTEAQVTEVAAVIREEAYEMRAILRRLFLSRMFYENSGTMVKMPVEHAIGFVRSTNLFMPPSTMRSELDSLAQVPSRPPSVFGWPQGSEWLSSEGMVERANLVRRAIENRTYQTDNGYELTLPSGDASTAGEVVDHFAVLLGVVLLATEREVLVSYMNTHVRNDDTREEDPFDPTETRDVDERVRGLLYILANHVDAVKR